MKVLFVHQNFPGQFLHLSAALANTSGYQVVALTMGQLPAPAGVQLRRYQLLRPAGVDTHPLLRHQENHVQRAEACAAAALQLQREGFTPDVIVAHPGWGEALFLKDVFPRARLLVYCEYYYAAEGQDVGFDPEIPPLSFAGRCQLRLKNLSNLLSMEIADAGISPTAWQCSTYPFWVQKKITVIHDGIDLNVLQPNPSAQLTLQAHNGNASCNFRPGNEVLTYVARNLEPVRGFQVFMRTLPEVLRRRPQAHAIIVGGDKISYGHHAPNNLSWREQLLNEVGGELDMQRVHFVGQLSYKYYLNLLAISRVHAYWTTPFVLSWSFLEAVASGIPVVASDTPPVREFSEQLPVNMLDFFDVNAYIDALSSRLAHPTRNPVDLPENLQLTNCVARQKNLLQDLA